MFPTRQELSKLLNKLTPKRRLRGRWRKNSVIGIPVGLNVEPKPFNPFFRVKLKDNCPKPNPPLLVAPNNWGIHNKNAPVGQDKTLIGLVSFNACSANLVVAKVPAANKILLALMVILVCDTEQ